MAAILFMVAASISMFSARHASGLEALWAANATLLGIMILCGRSRGDIAAIATGGLIGSLLLKMWHGSPMPTTILFSVANVVEALVALGVLHLLRTRAVTFERVGDVLALTLACAAGAAAAAMIGALGMALAAGVPFGEGWFNWFSSSLLSQLVFTPMIVVGAQLRQRRNLALLSRRSIGKVILILGSVGGVASVIFSATQMPLMFLITPVMMIATFHLRAFGAVAAMAIVAMVAATATATGVGPIVNFTQTPSQQVMILQLFLAVEFLSSLPVAAMLAGSDRRAEEARMLAQRFQSVVETIGEVIFQTDPDGRWSYLNPAWRTVTGHTIGESLGKPWLAHIDEADRDELTGPVESILDGSTDAVRRVLRFHTAQDTRWMEIFLQGLRDPDGAVVGMTGTMRDIDDRKRLEEHVLLAQSRAEQRAREATLLAATDELTGIANRRAFLRHLDREIEGSAEFGWPLAVAMFDVDHFKRVNDRHGHAVGDAVLRAIAARAGGVVRTGDMVGRLGGEEFGIIMPGATAADAALVAERLREAIELPHGWEEALLPAVTVSIGLAFREPGYDGATLLATADAALYEAKNAGRNRVRIAA